MLLKGKETDIIQEATFNQCTINDDEKEFSF